MRTGRPKADLRLTRVEQQELESLVRRARSAPAVAQRARWVLGCASGQDNKTVARRLRVAPATVGKWRQGFIEGRIAGCSMSPDRELPGPSRDGSRTHATQQFLTPSCTLRPYPLALSAKGASSSYGLGAPTRPSGGISGLQRKVSSCRFHALCVPAFCLNRGTASRTFKGAIEGAARLTAVARLGVPFGGTNPPAVGVASKPFVI